MFKWTQFANSNRIRSHFCFQLHLSFVIGMFYYLAFKQYIMALKVHTRFVSHSLSITKERCLQFALESSFVWPSPVCFRLAPRLCLSFIVTQHNTSSETMAPCHRHWHLQITQTVSYIKRVAENNLCQDAQVHTQRLQLDITIDIHTLRCEAVRSTHAVLIPRMQTETQKWRQCCKN